MCRETQSGLSLRWWSPALLALVWLFAAPSPTWSQDGLTEASRAELWTILTTQNQLWQQAESRANELSESLTERSQEVSSLQQQTNNLQNSLQSTRQSWAESNKDYLRLRLDWQRTQKALQESQSSRVEAEQALSEHRQSSSKQLKSLRRQLTVWKIGAGGALTIAAVLGLIAAVQ